MKILLAVDGSDDARQAVEFVANTPWLHAGNEVTLFTVVPPLGRVESIDSDPELVLADQADEAEAILDPVRSRLKAAGVAVHVDWAEGAAAETIVLEATRGCFGLIVMGCRGRGALTSLVAGSTTRGVMAGCRVPVLVIR